MNDGPSGPVVQPHNDPVDLPRAVKLLETRSYTTYLARLRASERLALRDQGWNLALVALSTATTVAAVGLLADPKMYGTRGGTLLTALAVLSLAASLVVTNLRYGARVAALSTNYKRIQFISIQAEAFFASNHPDPVSAYQTLAAEYASQLAGSENHCSADHKRRRLGLPWHLREGAISIAPYAFLVVPLGVMVPFIHWVANG